MTEHRKPVTTIAELETLDEAEILEGYTDGLALEPEPGGNRSKSYWHGWRNGRSDRSGKVDAEGLALARVVVEAAKRRAVGMI